MTLRSGDAIWLAELPVLDGVTFHTQVVEACAHGGRLGALFYLTGTERVVAIVLHDGAGYLQPIVMQIAPGGSYPSLTARLPEAQAFERALFEDHAIRPEGHPWLKPLRRHSALEGDVKSPAHPFFCVEGPGIHEVAVGPVHAGIIEPGHFRFQCSGETVHTLEIHLGYQHRGVIDLMLGASPARRLTLAESIAGDTVVGHVLAHCQAMEILSGCEPPLAAHWLRGIALELERISNHVGDLGALCGDVGYLPGAAWLGRLRGDFLNLLMELSGNRFGRGLIIPGGVRFAPSSAKRALLLERLKRSADDVQAAVQITFDTSSVISRFERTGTVSRDDARALGLVGPAARASGVGCDVRQDHSYGIYRFAHIPVAVVDSGDVMARALQRRIEIERSISFVLDGLGEHGLGALSDGPLVAALPAARPNCLAVGLVEGWRGAIMHSLLTDAAGELMAADVVDPSFHNWFGLALCLRGNQISDFPLCNKSFNLSYAGHDL